MRAAVSTTMFFTLGHRFLPDETRFHPDRGKDGVSAFVLITTGKSRYPDKLCRRNAACGQGMHRGFAYVNAIFRRTVCWKILFPDPRRRYVASMIAWPSA